MDDYKQTHDIGEHPPLLSLTQRSAMGVIRLFNPHIESVNEIAIMILMVTS